MIDRILVFIPCYNCAAQIGRVIARLDVLPPGAVAEVLVVDNGSSDGTREAASTALARYRRAPASLVLNRANFNLGGSHKAAFAYAMLGGFTHVVVLHGDDQADIADLLPVLAGGAHRRHDACLGARFMRGARLTGYGLVRRLGNRAFNVLFSIVAGRRIQDLGSGLNIFARSVFADPAVERMADDLRFNVYLLLRCIDARRRVAFFPISWREEDQVSNVRLVSQAWRTLAIAAQYAVNRPAFRNADHRDVVRQRYGFDIVHPAAEAAPAHRAVAARSGPDLREAAE